MQTKSLSEMLTGLSPVASVTSDSRQVKPGTVFVAIRGGSQDGHRFLVAAEKAGAVAAVGENPKPAELRIPYVQVPDSRLALAGLAASLHGRPSESMLVIGVTGTSGKTTTTYLLEAILTAAGKKVGVIGTVNFRYGGKILESTHTTPGSVELQKLLAEMRDGGCDAVIMEVSSHALKQHRTAFIAFDGAVFTNLSPEHLDFHPDMEDYFRAKKLLFTDMVDFAISRGKRPCAAINGEDSYGKRLIQDLLAKPYPGFRWSEYGLSPECEVNGTGLSIDLSGIRGRAGDFEIRSELTGRFNAFNILAAASIARGLGIPPEAVAQGLSSLRLVPGRLERVANPRGIHVLVDYAHKPDALEKVLRTLREVRGSHRLITVFGCGGDRDRKKRPVMGRLAVELSDQVVVTSDNPRTEDPGAIIQEILQGISEVPATSRSPYSVEPDRKKAIGLAISTAEPGDIVLIAGKGHEDYQIIADPAAPGGTRKIHFDDREVAAEALA